MDLPFAISVFCTSLAILSLGLFVLFSNKKSITNITYFLITVATFLWLYALSFAYTTENYQKALLFGKIKYTSVALLPAFFYHFLISFLDIKNSRQKIFKYFFYAASFIFITLIWFSSLMINGLYKYHWGMYPRGGILAPFFVLCFVATFFYYLFMLFFYYRTNRLSFSHARLLQIKWVFISFFLSAFAIPDFLPYFGINYKPLGYIAILLFLFSIAYSIVRHRVLDIEVIIKKTLIFGGIFVFVYAIFAFFALLGQIFFERFITQNRWIAMIPSVVVVTIMLRPLENFLINITDKYLFQKKYDYKDLLKIFTSEALTVLELDKLIRLAEEKIAEIMKLDYCKVFITDHPDIKIEATLKLPISMNNQTIGILLLGRKKSDEDYTQDDLDILQPLARTLAIAVSNARLVEELSEAQSEMAEKDKMATVGTLAAGMAHEIRNPITTIRVFSEYVADRLNEDEFRGKYRNVVTKEVDKIDHIIQTLIDFSGEDGAQQIAGISVYEAVQELISIISQNEDILGKIQFINNIPLDLPKISVNKEELDEIILNLTQNAIHAIQGKGGITFNAEEKDNSVILEIADTGCGMSEETAKNIFNPFFTTRSKGFGLGLFVVKQLVKRNRGDILVDSEIGRGTKFRLKFRKG